MLRQVLFFHAFCPSFHFSKQRFSCQLIQIGHHSGVHGACPFFHPAAAIFQPFGKHAHRSFRASHWPHSGGVNPSVFQTIFGNLPMLRDIVPIGGSAPKADLPGLCLQVCRLYCFIPSTVFARQNRQGLLSYADNADGSGISSGSTVPHGNGRVRRRLDL